MNQAYFIPIFVFLSSLIWTDHPGESSSKILQNTDCIECHSDLLDHEVMHPVAEDACDNCHQSTGESHPEDGISGFSLMDRLPDLCFYCHDELLPGLYGHSPAVRGECLSCHDVHGSSEPTLLKLPEQELCLSCHNRKYISDSSTTGNIRRLIRGNGMEHSAITGGGCLQCHLAHGSENRALLVDLYPEDNYVDAQTENFALCFLCHDTDLMDAEETDWGTNFRNGTRNLHQLHINGKKGRNCKLCHNMHGSPQKYLVEERVAFGNWEMKMNFIPAENGGSCLPGCHGYQTYER